MKRLIILFFLFSCLFLFYQCKQDVGKDLGTLSFTTQDLQIVPYKGGEKLTFKDSLGGVIQLQIDSPIFRGYQIEPEGDGSQYNYYNAENEIFESVDNSFNIQLWFPAPFTTNLEKRFDLLFSFSSGFLDGKYKFDAGIFSMPNSHITFYDSLTIISKKFYNVYGLFPTIPPSESTDTIKNIFYTLSQGFVGVNTSKGRWYLN